jgi:hypothetical protein
VSTHSDKRGPGRSPEATLRARFDRLPIAELRDLERALRSSGRTVARALKKLGYHSSFSHGGRFYTLVDIPRFDRHGLWFHEDVGFSRDGTLLATLERLVRTAAAGQTHEELRSMLRLRVQNSVRMLAEAGRVGRELVESMYVYVDPDPSRARSQLAKRRAFVPPIEAAAALTPLDPARVIDVLVLVIQRPRATASQIATTLRTRGLDLSEAQVEEVFARYALGKKTARSRSRRSRR